MNNKDELKNYLKKIKFSDSSIEDILDIVHNDIDCNVLHEKIKYLISLGLEARVIRIIIEEDPMFIIEDVSQISKNVNILKKYINASDLLIIVEVTPEILTMKDNSLEENINLIKIVIQDEENLKIIIKDSSEILTYNTNYLVERLEFLIKNGLKEKMNDILLTNLEIFELDEAEINIQKLKEEV